MESTLIIIFLVLFILPIIIISASHRRPKSRTPPGPRGLPLIGNLHQLKAPLHEYFWQLSKKYGPLIFMKLGSRPVLIVNSSKMAEQVLKTQDLIFCSRPAMIALRKMSYNGFDVAFSPYGEYWREMRKNCVLHLLSAKRVLSFRPIREDEVARMIGIISDQASDSEIVNLTDRIFFLTSSVISRLAFGKRYDQDSSERRQFNHIILEFMSTLSGFYFTDFFPRLGWLDNLTGKISRLEDVFQRWDSFYDQVINEHLRPDRPESMEGDVIDILLKLREEKSEGSFRISMENIKAVLVDVYFASTDTIATTIVWAMTSLIMNPTTMKKAQAEIRAIPSLKSKKKMVEEEDIIAAELPYLNAVIKESLRRYSTIPLLVPRETNEKCTIGGFEIPKKTLVYVNAWAVGNDPESWENPNEFVPERFLVDEKLMNMELKGQDFQLLPFGGGRRGCPGMTMALATVQIVLANLLYCFDWKLPDGTKIEDIDARFFDGMALHKKDPLYLVASKFI